jgi:hypothetical protein
MEWALEPVAGHVDEPVVRALVVGPAGSHEGTIAGTLKGLFGRRKRETGLHQQNVLVLTPTTVRLFACAGPRGRPSRVEHEVGAWPVASVRVESKAMTKESLGQSPKSFRTSKYYRLTLAVPGAEAPLGLECVRSDSARDTIEALEDATGSPPSPVTARRRKKRERERAAETAAEEET